MKGCSFCYGAVSDGACIECTSGNYYDSDTSNCATCSSKTTNCDTCALETGVCSTCSGNYVLDGNNACVCKGVIDASDSSCTQCASGTYFDATAGADPVCPTCASKTAQCTTCDLDSGVCTACDSGYFLDKSGAEPVCSVIPTCQQGEWLDDSTYTCVPCSTSIANCDVCSSD